MITATLVVLCISLILYCVKKAWEINQTWGKRGVKHVKPVLFFGNSLPHVLKQSTQCGTVENVCKQFPNDPVIGYYEFMTPHLFVKHPDLIQKILIKDFTHFTDHGFEINFENNPRDEHLFFMTGNRWRAFRTKISPIFTSGKLRDIFESMRSCANNLEEHLENRKTEDIDVRELMGLFSMDVIGAGVFGIDPGSLKNPDCEFRKIGKTLVKPNFLSKIRFFLLFVFPKLSAKLGLVFTPRNVSEYFINLIKQNLNYRKEKGLYRNDFTQMLLQLKEKGSVEVHSWDSNDDYLKMDETVEHIEKYEITDDLILSQAQAFMVAGFEGTAIIIMYTMFQMTQHKDIQDRAREEILKQVSLNGGLTYEALKNMKYLEAAIKETLRLYPFQAYLFRVCTKDYTLPDGLEIKQGDKVSIPIAAVHKDPEYYPDPEMYDPERFLGPIQPGTYLPFGEGPRICIATRYTLMVMKYGIAVILMKYKVKLSGKTKLPLTFKSRIFGDLPDSKIFIKLEDI